MRRDDDVLARDAGTRPVKLLFLRVETESVFSSGQPQVRVRFARKPSKRAKYSTSFSTTSPILNGLLQLKYHGMDQSFAEDARLTAASCCRGKRLLRHILLAGLVPKGL